MPEVLGVGVRLVVRLVVLESEGVRVRLRVFESVGVCVGVCVVVLVTVRSHDHVGLVEVVGVSVGVVVGENVGEGELVGEEEPVKEGVCEVDSACRTRLRSQLAPPRSPAEARAPELAVSCRALRLPPLPTAPRPYVPDGH